MVWNVPFLACIGLFFADVHRVLGNYDAQPNTWKWQVSLQYDSNNDGEYDHICGGSIANAFHILTAAHCILSMSARQYRVVISEYNLYEYDAVEQYIGVEGIIVHPDWNGELSNGYDIAVLSLVDPVHDSGFVEVAGFPPSGQTLPHDFTCLITGWGLMNNTHRETMSDVLQAAPIKVVEHSVCSQPNWWGSFALKTMVCAGGDGDIEGCQGDSGGPLNCYTDGAWRVHGVVSYGPAGECNQETKPIVFTKVSSFIDWLHTVTNGL